MSFLRSPFETPRPLGDKPSPSLLGPVGAKIKHDLKQRAGRIATTSQEQHGDLSVISETSEEAATKERYREITKLLEYAKEKTTRLIDGEKIRALMLILHTEHVLHRSGDETEEAILEELDTACAIDYGDECALDNILNRKYISPTLLSRVEEIVAHLSDDTRLSYVVKLLLYKVKNNLPFPAPLVTQLTTDMAAAVANGDVVEDIHVFIDLVEVNRLLGKNTGSLLVFDKSVVGLERIRNCLEKLVQQCIRCKRYQLALSYVSKVMTRIHDDSTIATLVRLGKDRRVPNGIRAEAQELLRKDRIAKSFSPSSVLFEIDCEIAQIEATFPYSKRAPNIPEMLQRAKDSAPVDSTLCHNFLKLMEVAHAWRQDVSLVWSAAKANFEDDASFNELRIRLAAKQLELGYRAEADETLQDVIPRLDFATDELVQSCFCSVAEIMVELHPERVREFVEKAFVAMEAYAQSRPYDSLVYDGLASTVENACLAAEKLGGIRYTGSE